jgi:hypothetical protein
MNTRIIAPETQPRSFDPYAEAKKLAQSRGEIFCGWCWNKPRCAGFWKDSQGNLWCNRCQPKEGAR